ncbi:MAG: beta-aspartyl-peptidase [Deltaproteobacteria bacterium]|nr:beta-aspartyl-peptidase [Deltaproteobacteria bacterium]
MPAAIPSLQLLRNARLYAPDPRGVVDVLIAGERIAAVGRDLESPPKSWGCTVHELDGALVLPGLVDAHVHLSGGGGESGPETRVPPLQFTQLTMAGVTSVVGLLGTDGTTRHPAELLAATRAMQRLGLSAWMWTGAYPVPTPTLTGSVRGDIVTVEQVIGAGEIAISDHRSSQPTFDELARLAAECHVGGLLAGKAGVLHLHLGDGRRGLELVRRILLETEIPARVLQPTHCNRNASLWVEAMELGGRGLPVDITAFPPDDDDEALPAAVAVAQWLDAGTPTDRLTLSSDGGGCLPVWDRDGQMVRMDVGSSHTLLQTLGVLYAAGRPLEAILPLCTRNVARQLRLRGKGEVAVGADADLLVVDDALTVRALWARGRQLVTDGAALVRGPFESGGAA